ncbi:hypothetical protein ACHAC9_23890 [Massilia sp. CMS3.1]|uniref:hypothetical protein n=1 Tax=Massilia sp. CMS3.1 TaxID=3373083 RepID=UPI003EE4FEA8
MPKLLHHIDEIACQQQHDVIFVEFHHPNFNHDLDCRANQSRTEIINWLAHNNIPHWECSSSPSSFGDARYRGEIYIDVPYNIQDPLYLKVEAFFENPDGTMRFEGAWFRGYTLASCVAHLNMQ